MKSIECFFLTPFRHNLTPVYDEVVKPCIEKAAQLISSVNVSIIRADRKYVTDDEKVREIQLQIKRSDFLVADLTGLNPNVMWEVGYAQACNKNVILIGQRHKSVPFNIRTRDILFYTNTTKGRSNLYERLNDAVNDLLAKLALMQRTFLSLATTHTTSELVKTVFGQHEVQSLSSVFLHKEMNRTNVQFTSLSHGIYVERRERPINEILDTYSKILGLLDEQSKFYTVTCPDFWLNITEGGNNVNYLNFNQSAAIKRAKIRRVFFVNKNTYHKEELRSFRILVKRVHQALQGFNNVELRICFSESYVADSVGSYRNIALVEHGSERLVISPDYSDTQSPERRMLATYFYHHYHDAEKRHVNHDNVDKFKQHRINFMALWDQSQKLRAADYEKLL